MSKKAGQEQGQAISLPKNIQQIGSTDSGIKIYLEDYSGTYLRRILLDNPEKHGILLGKKQVSGKQTYLFVQAVVIVEIELRDKYWKYNWNHIYELMQRYFIEEGEKKPEILGWAMSVESQSELSVEELEKMHKCNFDGNMSLAFVMDIIDGKDQFYILENNKFHVLGGYYIYYEKNKNMHTYVLENQPGPCVETEEIVKGNSESYRTILMKRKEMLQKKQTVSLLYVASTFLVMIVVVLGITMMNNYEKMQNMQATLNDLSKTILNEEAAYQPDEVPTTQTSVRESDSPIPQETQEGDRSDAVMAMSQAVAQSSQAVEASPQSSKESGSSQMPESSEMGQASETPQASEPEPSSESGEAVRADDDTKDDEEAKDAQGGRRRYEIQSGDTLLGISWKIYHTDKMVDEICEYNDIEDGDKIVAGDVLILP